MSRRVWEALEPLGSLLEPFWEPLGAPFNTLWDPLRARWELFGTPEEQLGSQRGPKGRQAEAKGGQREAKRRPGSLPWRLLGASLAKEDFESKMSKLAEAFHEN